MKKRAAIALLALLAATLRAEAQVTLSANIFRFATGPCHMRSGSGTPSPTLGSACDTYVNTASPYGVWVKTASGWVPMLSVEGVAVGSVLASNGVGAPPVYTATPSVTSVTAASSMSTPALTAAASLTINPTGDLVLSPSGLDVLPSTNYTTNIGAVTAKFRELHASEMWVESLVQMNTIATLGGRFLVAPTTTLASDLSAVATSMSVEHNALASGDRVVMQSGGRYEMVAVTSSASGSGPYTYTITRDADLTGANTWPAGTAMVNTGTTGNGYVDVYSLWSINQPQFSYVFNFNATGSAYSSNYAESESWAPFGDGATNETNDAVYFGAGATFSAISQWCSTGLTPTTATFVWEYWNGSAWTSTTPTGTLSALGRNNTLFGTLTGWATTTVNGASAYWVRVRLTNNPSPAMTAASCFLPARAARTWGPTIAGNVRTGTGYNDIATRWMVGNLNGSYGYSTDTYGAAFGDPSGINVTIDAEPSTGGFRIRSGTTDKFKADTSGNLSIVGDLSVGTAGSVRSGATAYGTGTGYWLDYNSGSPRFRVGTVSGDRLVWDGTNLVIVSSNFAVDSSGVTIAPSTIFSTLRAYRFTTTSGTLGLFAADPDGSGRRAVVQSLWTGSGDYSGGPALVSGIWAKNEPISGGTFAEAYVYATANISGGVDSYVDVKGTNVRFTNGSSNFRLNMSNQTATAYPYIRTDGNYLVIESRTAANGGNVYIASDNSADVYLTSGGGTTRVYTGLVLNGLASCTLQVNGSGSVGCVSDAAAKRDIKTWGSGLATINRLRPVSYRWAEGPDTGRHIGFIAQEVQGVIPEAVARQSWGGQLTLDDRAILAALVNAVQELSRARK